VRLDYSAVSDVGRVRKDNQDSGYVGPHLLAVCDGVGGAARGDIASSEAIQQLRKLDAPFEGDGEAMLGQVSGALLMAHKRIAQLVDQEPSLNGTSTTATVALFDGSKVALGHVGDSRAYLFRKGEISQLTRDHTFVQTLIDEGRITEDEARVHPHRNLILRAVDGTHELEPDLFLLELTAGDRLLLCSDGASGVLGNGRLADILSSGSPDYAAVELVRASLEAGSSDNVTCLVADLVEGNPNDQPQAPLMVGAAADMKRRSRGKGGSLFRGHRAGDTGELEPIAAEVLDEVPFAIHSDPLTADPEAARYAPRAPGRFRWMTALLVVLLLAGIAWVGLAVAWSWSQKQYYVGEDDGTVVIFRGVNASLPGVELSQPYETTNVEIDRLPSFDAGKVREGIDASSLDSAHRTVENLAKNMAPADAAEAS
jgi:serine/threonine protein phosphatase PrpC